MNEWIHLTSIAKLIDDDNNQENWEYSRISHTHPGYFLIPLYKYIHINTLHFSISIESSSRISFHGELKCTSVSTTPLQTEDQYYCSLNILVLGWSTYSLRSFSCKQSIHFYRLFSFQRKSLVETVLYVIEYIP